MNRTMRIIGLIGSIIVVAWGGIPYIFPEVADGLTFLRLTSIERTVILSIGIFSLIVAITGKGKWMVFAGLLGIIAVCYKLAQSYITLYAEIQRITAEGPDAIDSAEQTMETFRYLWAWGVIVLGPVLIIGAGGLSNDDDS